MKKQNQKRTQAPVIEVLEPRLLFSADLFGGVIDDPLADDPVARLLDEATTVLEPLAIQNQNAPVESAGQEPLPEAESEDTDTLLNMEPAAKELVLIDSATPDYQQLLNDLLAQQENNRQTEVVLLDASQDGVSQVSRILVEHSDLGAVHLISHASDSVVSLGSSRLDINTLLDNSTEIEEWGDAFAEEGDLLIYGCNLASSEDGEALIEQLASLTGADVAASDDLTGSAHLGGDWDLEYQTGEIETRTAVSDEVQQHWSGVLASPGNILFVVGDTALSASDTAIQTQLTGKGHTLTIVDDDLVTSGDAAGQNLVLISETVNSGTVGTTFTNEAVPVLTFEPWLLDDLGMTGTTAGTDYGETVHTQIDILDTSHYLSAGLTGTVTVYSASNEVQWGDPNANAIEVASLSGSPGSGSIFAYEMGAVMPGMTAPDTRAFFFLDFDAGGDLTTDGWTLFDNAVDWSMNGTPVINFTINSTPGISEELTETATFTLTLSGDALVDDNTASVDITASGSGLSGSDYDNFITAIATAAGSTAGVTFDGVDTLTFDSAFNSGTGLGDFAFTVDAIDDAVEEGTETIVATLTNASVSSGNVSFGTFSDSFTEASDTFITAHTPDSGLVWTEVYDTSPTGTDATIDATGVIRAGSDENQVGQAYAAGPAPTSGDQSISFTLKEIETDNGTKPVGIFGRWVDSDNFYYLQILPNDNAQDSLQLSKVEGGVRTVLDTVDATIKGGDAFQLDITDATKKVLHNGVEVLSSVDNALTAVGNWGLFFGKVGDSGGATGGHLRSTWGIDNFLAEDGASSVTTATNITETDVDNLTAVVVNQSLSVAEGASNTAITLSELQSTDADTDDTTLIYTVGDVANGTLTINGGAWASSTNHTFTQQDIIDGNVLYSHDGSETSSDSFSYTVEDSAGNQLTGQTFSITVSAVNDAPTISASPLNPTYTEGNSAVDLFDTVSIDTIENGQTIEQTVFTITNVTDGSHETITLDGSTVYLVDGDNDTTVSGYDYMVDIVGNTATITIDTVGTSAAAVRTLIDGLVYQNSSQNPTEASRLVTLTSIRDSGGTANGGSDTSSPGLVSTVAVVAANNAPIVDLNISDGTTSNFSTSFTEGDGAVSVAEAGAIVSDVDGTAFQLLSINLVSFADGASERVTAGGYAFTYGVNEVVVRTVGSTDFEIDFDGTGFSISKNLSGNMPLDDLQSLIRSITYENSSQNPTAGNRTINISVQDAGGLQSAVATSTIAVTAVDDAPVNAVPSAQTISEDSTLTFSLANGNQISISDESGETPTVKLTVDNGTLAVSGSGSASVTNDETAAVTISGSVSDINAALEGLQYTPTQDYSGSDTLTIITTDGEVHALNIDSDLTAYFEFNSSSPASDSSPAGTHSGSLMGDAFSFSDPTRKDSLHLDGSGDYLRINSQVTSSQQLTLSSWVKLSAGASTSEVIDMGYLASLRVDASNGVQGSYWDGSQVRETTSSRHIDGDGWHHIAYTIDSAANTQTIYVDGVALATTNYVGDISFSGGTGVTQIGASSQGSPNYFSGHIDDARIYDRVLSAGEIANLANAPDLHSDNDSITINVTALNDDPANDGSLPSDVTVTEDVQGFIDLSSVVLRDVDAGNGLLTVTLSTSTGGKLWAFSDLDVTVSGSGTSTLTLSGGLADLNNFFSSATRFSYQHGTTHTAGDNADTIQVSINDNGNTGTGGSGTIVLGTVNVDITAVNDAPVDLQAVATNEGGASINADGGNDTYFVADNGAALLGGLTTVTIESTFSITTPGADLSPLLSYADGSNDEELGLFLKSDGRIWFGVHSNGSPIQSTVGNYSQLFDGAVHHVGVSWDASNGAVVFYIDGAEVESFNGYQTGQVITGGGELVFGQDQDSELGGFKTIDVFSGTLYDVRIFNDIRTSGEIAASYNQTLPSSEAGMIANWAFDDMSVGGEVTDTVSGNNLTERHVVGTGFSASTPVLTFSVLENATNGTAVGKVEAIDPDSGDTFTYSLSDDAGGRFDISAGGQVTLLNASLIDFETATSHNITVRATDSDGLTYDEVFSVSVINVNEAPSGSDKTVTVNEDTDHSFTAGDFGFSDVSDNPADSLASVIITTAPSNGVLYVDANNDGIEDGGEALVANNTVSVADITAGRLKFKPVTDAYGMGYDSFTFQVRDDGGTANSGADTDITANTITINVTPVDDASVVTGDISFNGNEGDTVSGDLNATDVEGLADGSYFSVTGAASHGTAVIDATSGAWTFTPSDPNWFGSDSFTVTVTDDLGGTTTQTINVTLANVDDASVITGDVSFNGNEGDTVSGDLNATDVEGLTDGSYFSVTGAATHGTAAIDSATGAWTFTPTDPNWSGSDSFEVTVTDDLNGTTTQLVSITLANVNDAPVATDDPGKFNALITSLSPLSYWRLGETSGPTAADESGLNNGSYSGVTLGQADALAGDTDTAARFDGTGDYVEIAHDAAYLLGNGTVQLWFNADTPADGDLQHLFSKDSNGNDTGGHLSIYLDGSGKLSVRLQSASSSYYLSSTSAVSGNAWHHTAVSFGTEGMQLYLDGVLIDTDAYTGGLGTTSGGAGNFEPIAIGAGTQNSGNLVVTPVSQLFTGLIDEVAIIGNQLSAETIQDLFAAGLQNYTTDENGTLNVSSAVGVLSNDFDVDGDSLSVVELNGNALDVGNPVLLASGAQLTLNADGSMLYDPNGQFEHLDVGETATDTFTYRVGDGNGGSNTGSVTITINGAEDASVIGGTNTGTVAEDGSLTASNTLSISDVDTSDNPVSFIDVAATAGSNGYGTFEISGNTWTYTLDNSHSDVQALDVSESLTDSYTFTATDGSTRTVTVTIEGAEDASVTGGTNTGTVAEDGSLTASNTLSISDVDTSDNPVSFIDVAATAGINGYGTFEISGNTWTYTLDNTHSDVQALDESESLTDSYTFAATDGSTRTVTVTIEGAEDASVTGGTNTGTVAEDGSLTASNTLSISDVDTSDNPVSFIDVAATAGTNGYGTFEISGNTWIYTLDNTHSDVQALDVSESLTDSYTFTATDGSTRTVTVTIEGAEDASVTGGTNTGTVAEDGSLTASNTLSISDVDTLDNPVSFIDVAATAGSNGYGTFEISGNTWIYTLDNSHANVQALDVSESLTDSYTFTATDGSTRTVTVTIEGAEDASVTGGTNTGTVAEDGSLTASNTLSISDVDTSDNPVSFIDVAATAGSNGYGTFEISGNTWIYTLDNSHADVQALDVSESLTDSYTFTATDGATRTVTVTIDGAEDASVIGGTNTGTVAEDGSLTASNTLSISDVDTSDNPVSFIDVAATAGSNGYGTFEISGNSWTYTLDNSHADVQALDVSESLTDSYTFTATDGATRTVTVTIDGAEDASVIGGTNTGTVAEDGSLTASNTLSISDVDTSDNPVSFIDVAATAGSNGYGTFEISGNSWTYTLDNSHSDVQALDVSESLTDSYTFTATDGATRTVTVTIEGAEDAPTVANVVADQVATEDAVFSFTFAANTFSDVDSSDALTYTAQLNGGGALPGWLSFDNATRTFSGTPLNTDVGVISIDIIASDGVSSVADTFTLTINNSSDAPVIGGIDAGSVTEDIDPNANTLLETAGALTIADPDVGESSFIAGIINGSYGDLVIDAAGNWSYSADNTQAAIQALDVTESLIDTLTVTTVDGSTHDVVITINGAEDASVTGGTNTGTVAEDGSLTASNTLSISDVDTSDNPVSFIDVAATAGSNGYGTFEISGNSWTYTLDNTHSDVQALDVSESLTDSYTFTATDGATRTVTVTIEGAEDASVISGTNTGTVAEDGSLTASNTLSISDIDTSDNPVSFVDVASTAGSNGYGTFEISGNSWTYTLDNSHADVQALDVSESLTDSYTFTASDGSTRTVTVTIEGAEDASVIGGTNTGTVAEDGSLTASNTLSISDVDTLDNPVSFIDVAATAGAKGYGTFEISGNSWTYTLDNSHADVQALDVSESLTDSYTFTATDGATRTVTVTIDGAEDASVIGGTNTGTVAEDGSLTASNTLSISDIDTSDNPVSFVDVAATAGANGYGTFEISGNSWTYTLDNSHADVQALDVSESLTDSYTFTATDGATRTVTVTIDGAEDASVIGGTNTGTVAEDGSLTASNTLSISDVDTSDNPVSFIDVAATAGSNGYGTFEISGNSWTYTLDNSHSDVQALDVSESLTDSYTFTATDGATRTVTVTIEGAEDASVITGDLSFSGNEGDSVSGDLNATDIDGLADGDYFSVTGAATHGTATIDAATGAWTFIPSDPDWFGSDSFTVTVTDDLDGTTTQLVSITLANVDDASVITGDISSNVNEGDTVSGDLNATDVDGLADGSYFSVTAAATRGTAAIDSATGAWTFTPTDPNWFGSDSFTVTVTDDLGGTTTQTINVTLANVDDASVITGNISFNGNEGDSVSGDLNATDVEGLADGSYFSVTDAATHGTAAIDSATGSWTFTPTDPNWIGSDSFTVTVTDDLSGTTTQLVSITLVNVDEATVFPEQDVDQGTGSNEADDQKEGQQADAGEASEEQAGDESDLIESEVSSESVPVAAEIVHQEGEAVEMAPMDGALIARIVAEVPEDRDRIETEGDAYSHPIPPKAIDLSELTVAAFELKGLEPVQLKSLMDNDSFVKGLEDMNRDVDQAMEQRNTRYQLAEETAIGITISLSAGFVSWVLRAGSLMASFMSVVPLWKQLDPLPVLGAAAIARRKDSRGKDEKDDETKLEDIFEEKNSD